MGMAGKNSVLGGGGFHHVALKVHNFEKAVQFYKDLGCTQRTAWGEGDKRGILLDAGDGNYIEIFAGGPDIQHDPRGAGAAIFHLALRTNDVDTAIKTAERAGGVVTVPP